MAHPRPNNQPENMWDLTPQCSMEAPGPFHPLFTGCNSHDRNHPNDGKYQWPGLPFNGPFPHKTYGCPSNNKREPESGEKGAAEERDPKAYRNSNEPRTTPFVPAAPFFEHQDPWTRGCEAYENGGRGLHPGWRGQYEIGSINWYGPWGNFGPSMGFRPWGGFGPWSNFLPFWGNPRFTGGFSPPNTMGPWGRFGPINCFRRDEYAPRDDTEPEFNVFETRTSFVVCISLFDANKAGLKVELDLKRCELGIQGTIHRREEWPFLMGSGQNSNREFQHKLHLGNRINQTQIQIDSVTAKMEDGILIVSIPKLNCEHAEIKKVHIE